MKLEHFRCMEAPTPWVSTSLQDPHELRAFLEIIERENVRSYLEIGVHWGGTFEAVMSWCPRGSLGVTVDFPGGEFGVDDSFHSLLNSVGRLRGQGYNIPWPIFGPSSAPEVVARVRKLGPYDGQTDSLQFDCILIDGDHSYGAINRDFELYAPMGRMIALHDIAAPDGYKNNHGLQIDVGTFWREIKDKYRSHEIIYPGSEMGIGIVWTD